MEFTFEFPKEEFTEFFENYVGGGEDTQSEGHTSAQGVEYNGENVGEYLADAGMTVLIGLVVVISTLLVLSGIFKVFGVVMSAGKKKPKKKEEPEALKPAQPAPAKAPAAPVVQNGVSDEVVAVIAAAVTAMTPEGKRYAVKRISRADAGGRSAWSSAGLAENTRPF